VLADEEVDGLVLGWLKKRKYDITFCNQNLILLLKINSASSCRSLKSSFEILELELKARGQQDSGEGSIWSTDADLAQKGLVVSLGAEGDAEEYARQYRRFAHWVGLSLDIYQVST